MYVHMKYAQCTNGVLEIINQYFDLEKMAEKERKRFFRRKSYSQLVAMFQQVRIEVEPYLQRAKKGNQDLSMGFDCIMYTKPLVELIESLITLCECRKVEYSLLINESRTDPNVYLKALKASTYARMILINNYKSFHNISEQFTVVPYE